MVQVYVLDVYMLLICITLKKKLIPIVLYPSDPHFSSSSGLDVT